MVKVKCKICGNTGYTAAPDHIICKCGGRVQAVEESAGDEKEDDHK